MDMPLHWLAYWDDHESISYLLENSTTKVDNFLLVMQENKFGMTPLDICGRHKCKNAAMIILEFFCKHEELLLNIFNSKNA